MGGSSAMDLWFVRLGRLEIEEILGLGCSVCRCWCGVKKKGGRVAEYTLCAFLQVRVFVKDDDDEGGEEGRSKPLNGCKFLFASEPLGAPPPAVASRYSGSLVPLLCRLRSLHKSRSELKKKDFWLLRCTQKYTPLLP